MLGVPITAFGQGLARAAFRSFAIRNTLRGGEEAMDGARRNSRGYRVLAGCVAAMLAACALAAGPPAAAPAAPLAVVTDVDGAAALKRSGHVHAVAALELLGRSDELVLPAAARVEIAFFAGAPRVFVLSGPGRFALSADEVRGLQPDAQIAVRDLAPAWRWLRIKPGLVGRASVALRGAPSGALSVDAPVGAQLDTDLKVLRWRPPYGRDAANWQYSVRLIDWRGAVLFSTRTRAAWAELPAQLSWEHEQPYLWTVEAVADDGRRAAAASEFRIVDQATQEQVRALARIARQVHDDAAGAAATAEDVLLALALDQAGLRSKADEQWRVVALARPAFAWLGATRP